MNLNEMPELPSPVEVLTPPRGLARSLDMLLRSPRSLTSFAEDDSSLRLALRLVAGALVLSAAYGASAGFFQGGAQIALAAAKAPLVLMGSVLLCAPSLYVFAALTGAAPSGRRFVAALAGFAAMLGLLLLALLPIGWLFSMSSRSLLFAMWIHVVAWVVAVVFAARFLAVALHDDSRRKSLALWTVLFALVSFQVATSLGPILWRDPKAPLVFAEKRFFLDPLEEAARHDDGAQKPQQGGDGAAPPAKR